MAIEYRRFAEIDLADPFFDSLKQDYAEFPVWFARKAEDRAYIFVEDGIQGFLYLKVEEGGVDDVTPPLPPLRRLKVGTFKINAHGTRLGERYMKKIFDHAITERVAALYVTVFARHAPLVALFERYGFDQVSQKVTANGEELVLQRTMPGAFRGIVRSYPLVNLRGTQPYLLSLYPRWHTRLLPDSILRNENATIVEDISHTNSIHKVYLASMHGMERLRPGDLLVIYRTSDNQGPAHYRSVVTSICVLEEYRPISSFGNEQDFLAYCRPYSVFNDRELQEFWQRRRYPHIIRFTYNFALRRRITRGALLEHFGLQADAYFGFLPLTHDQFLAICREGGIDESLVIR